MNETTIAFHKQLIKMLELHQPLHYLAEINNCKKEIVKLEKENNMKQTIKQRINNWWNRPLTLENYIYAGICLLAIVVLVG